MLIKRQTEVSASVTLLCRFLRDQGFNISPSDETDALRALSLIDFRSKIAFRDTLRTCIAKNEYQYKRFNELYDDFWYQVSKGVDSKIKTEVHVHEEHKKNEQKQAHFSSIKDWLNLNESDEEEYASYSDLETFSRKNFSELDESEMEQMMRVLQKLARKVAHKKSRLKKSSKSLKRLDLKKTIRHAMKQGGELNHWKYFEPKTKRFKIVVLCDVSKSMDIYSRFFIHMIYAFQNSYDKIETFVFSTAIHRVSDMLNNLEFSKAYKLIFERVPQWSGGTSIGRCFTEFVDQYAHHLLDRKTVVMILSDGWDTGSPELISSSMRKIHKNARKIIWMNPLAGSASFEPKALGMKSALPYIDHLASAHNLESMVEVLNNLGKR